MTTHERAVSRIGLEAREVVDLACLASLAVRIEPHLLRRLRLALLPDLDVGTEADLWFSSLIETRGVKFIVLDAGVAGVLREILALDRDRLNRTYAITCEAHEYASPSILLEETLNYLALKEGDNRRDAINEAFKPALRTIAAGGKSARDLAQWALRALPRLLEGGALECENGIALAMAASAVLGKRQIVAQVPELDVPFERIAWVLPADSLHDTTTIALELVDRGLRFLESGPPERTLELPVTTPLLLELSWSAGGTTIATVVQAVPGRSIDLGVEFERITIRTLAGAEYLLEAQPEIEPAESTATKEPKGRESEADGAELLENLHIATEKHDLDLARATVDALVRRIHESDVAFPEDVAEEVLSLLRGQRWHDLQLQLGKAFVESGVTSPSVRRIHAKLLIDQNQLDHAEKLLAEMITGTKADPKERAELLGLLGRIYKIRYFEADDPGSRSSRDFLSRSIDAYREGYELDPGNRWQGVNAMALALRAARDGVETSAPVNPEAMAKRILVEVERDVGEGKAGPWDYATAAEAALALDRKEETLRWIERYLDEAGIDVAGVLQQFEKVWQLKEHGLDGQLLKVLRAEVLREGGRVTLPEGAAGQGDTDRTKAASSRPAVQWFETGLERARSVALLANPSGEVFASGFLVEAQGLSETLASHGLLLMTSSHAVSQPTLRLEDIAITFDSAGLTETFAAREVVWASPADQLDVSLLRLDRSARHAGGLPLASRLPSVDNGRHVYSIGYPMGSGRTFTLQSDTLLAYEGPRVHYTSQAEPGSSGSPVFDEQWSVIAVHRGRGPEDSEGISIQSIREAIYAGASAEPGEQHAPEPQPGESTPNYWLREDTARLVAPALEAAGYGEPENITFDDLPDRLPVTRSRSAHATVYLIQLPDDTRQLSRTLQSIFRMTAGRFLFFAESLPDEIRKTLEEWSTEGLQWQFVSSSELPDSPPSGEAAVEFAVRLLGLEAADTGRGTGLARVFLSYAHADKEWMERFRTSLRSVEEISLTVHTDISQGEEWEPQIRHDIESADVAILLVTADYLNSDFIQQVELPIMLRRAESGELLLIPVAVRPIHFEKTLFGNYQFANDPSRPLASLTNVERDRAITEIIRRVLDRVQLEGAAGGEATL